MSFIVNKHQSSKEGTQFHDEERARMGMRRVVRGSLGKGSWRNRTTWVCWHSLTLTLPNKTQLHECDNGIVSEARASRLSRWTTGRPYGAWEDAHNDISYSLEPINDHGAHKVYFSAVPSLDKVYFDRGSLYLWVTNERIITSLTLNKCYKSGKLNWSGEFSVLYVRREILLIF